MSNVKGIGHGHGHGPPGLSQDSGRGVGRAGDGPPGLSGNGPPGLRTDNNIPNAGNLRTGGVDPGQDPLSQLSQLAQTLGPTNAPQDLPRDVPRAPPGQAFQQQPENPLNLVNTDAQLRGEAPPAARPVQQLVPDLQKAQTLTDVRERFSTDYALLKQQVVDVPHLPAQEKAQRAFQFFAAYAAQFVAVATGQAQNLPPNPNPEAAQNQKNVFQREAPVQATSEESQLGEGGEGGEGQGEAGQVGGRLGKLLDKATRGRDDILRRGGREGGQQLADLLPFNRFGQGQGPQLPAQTQLQSEAQAFTQVLRDLHFDEMHDERSGKNGLQVAQELLGSKSVAELERKAEDVQIRAEDWSPALPTPDDAAPEDPNALKPGPDAYKPKVKKDLGESRPELDYAVEAERVKGSPEPQPMRVQPWSMEAPKVVLPQQSADLSPRPLDGDDRSFIGRLTDKKLGKNMIWNVLHRLRGHGADSSLEKGEWDKLTFGAICLLVLLVLLVIGLVAL